MNDLVARLRAQPTERTYDSVGRAYDFPKHLIEEAASRISQQDSELDRMRRELEEAREARAILEGHLSVAIDDYNEARAGAFREAAEIIRARMPLYTELQALNACRECISSIRAKAEETRT